MANRQRFFAVLFCCALCWHASAQQVFRFATVENFPPFVIKTDAGLSGIGIDMVNEMAKKLGVKVVYEAYPWARCVEMVKSGSIDGILGMSMNEERKEFAFFAGPLMQEGFHVFSKASKKFNYTGLESLYGKTVGVNRGSFISKEFESAVKDGKIKMEEVDTADRTNIKKLMADRVDAIIGNSITTLYHAKLEGVAGQVVSLGSVTPDAPIYLALSKKAPFADKENWQAKMGKVLDGLYTSGFFKSLVEKYSTGK